MPFLREERKGQFPPLGKSVALETSGMRIFLSFCTYYFHGDPKNQKGFNRQFWRVVFINKENQAIHNACPDMFFNFLSFLLVFLHFTRPLSHILSNLLSLFQPSSHSPPIQGNFCCRNRKVSNLRSLGCYLLLCLFVCLSWLPAKWPVKFILI